MARLKNHKHETFVQKLAKNNLDAVKTYKEVYPDADPTNDGAIQSSATRLMNREEVKARIHEIFNLVFTPTALKKKLTELLHAQKPIIYNGEITGTYNDNANQLETLKLFLKSADVIGGRTSDTGTTITNNTQLNVNVIDSESALSIAKEIKSLSGAIKKNPIGKRTQGKQ